MPSPIVSRFGSELIEPSRIFACRHDLAPMAYVTLPCGEPALECPDCGWTCALDCAADACPVQDDLAHAGLAVIAQSTLAPRSCWNCGGAHHIQACPEIAEALGPSPYFHTALDPLIYDSRLRAMARDALGLEPPVVLDPGPEGPDTPRPGSDDDPLPRGWLPAGLLAA